MAPRILSVLIPTMLVMSACVTNPQRSHTSVESQSVTDSCGEVPYTVGAKKVLGSFRAGVVDELAKQISISPELGGSITWLRERLLSSAAQAHKDVLTVYFCRVREGFSEDVNGIREFDAALDQVIDQLYRPDNFTDFASLARTEDFLRTDAAKALNEKKTLNATKRGDVLRLLKTSGFSNISAIQADLKLALGKYKVDFCAAALVASTANQMTAALANSLDSLAPIVADTLTGSRDGIVAVRRLKDGAYETFKAVDASSLAKSTTVDEQIEKCVQLTKD